MASVLCSLVIVIVLICTPFAYAQEDEIEPCSITRFDPNCSPSGWVSIIFGDITLTITIGILIYYLQKRTSGKISEAITYIQKVIEHEEESKKRQTIFASQSIKNYFGVILMVSGLMNQHLKDAKTYNDVPDNIRDKYVDVIRMTGQTNHTLNMASRILDPVLTGQILVFIGTIVSIRPELGVGIGFPKYDNIKKDIENITAKLDTYLNDDDAILK